MMTESETIKAIKKELEKTLSEIEKSWYQRKEDEEFDTGFERDEGWIEGLRYALGVVDIQKAVFSIKEKK